ncbi:MAG TPA: T9SS type A sorting domain-containing protein [Chitinophagaceae bacterium]|nr:T9SS type A sorting domain-containing protein [Chitinophagaceae bacterium]
MKKPVTKKSVILFFVFIAFQAMTGNNLFGQNIDFGKSYINVTKGLNGGTVETGDTLEIRASFVVRSGTYDSCRYQDAVPAGTSFITGTIRVLTNEGKIYKQFTDGYGDDPGWITGSNVTIHLGFNGAAAPATAFRRGRVANTHKPSNFGNTCIMIASFRVRVTAANGAFISSGGGNMTYKNGAAAIVTFTFPSNTIAVYTNYSICSNTVGTNALGTEFNGTFGSGQPRNRGASANVPTGYTYQVFTTSNPNDYNYGIANNTSTRTNYSISNSWAKPDASSPTHRVFQLWDIIGDHTGAASPSAGNPPADTAANPNAGYMLIVNAAYRIDSAFQQTITGLCPNTFYEISCWMRNICSKCACDSNGKAATNSSGPPYYIPTGPGDSSGVAPNITFEVNGIDYYTTGNILYTGNWVKKGFTYLTGPAQTSFTLKYFNNAPGGGGNDWALDDIAVATCSPSMIYTPNTTPIVCDSNILTMTDTVRSFYNNYVYYKWQRSTDGGATWVDVTAATGPVAPYWNGTEWEYVSTYIVPPGQTQAANNGDMYRLVTSTTLANLTDPLCSFTDQGSIVTIEVIDCDVPLAAKFLRFTGKNNGSAHLLEWTTETENEPLVFEVQKSTDGLNFQLIGTMDGYNNISSPSNQYAFTNRNINGDERVYYRIVMKNLSGQSTVSRTILLGYENRPLMFLSVINPFSSRLSFDVLFTRSGKAKAELVDAAGRVVRSREFTVSQGPAKLELDHTDELPAGIYYLRVIAEDKMLKKTVLKNSQ